MPTLSKQRENFIIDLHCQVNYNFLVDWTVGVNHDIFSSCFKVSDIDPYKIKLAGKFLTSEYNLSALA